MFFGINAEFTYAPLLEMEPADIPDDSHSTAYILQEGESATFFRYHNGERIDEIDIESIVPNSYAHNLVVIKNNFGKIALIRHSSDKRT